MVNPYQKISSSVRIVSSSCSLLMMFSLKFLFISTIYLKCCHGFVQPSHFSIAQSSYAQHQDQALSFKSKYTHRCVLPDKLQFDSSRNYYHGGQLRYSYSVHQNNNVRRSTKLQSSHILALPAALPKSTKTLLMAASMLLFSILNKRRLLWPGSLPDPTVKEPLPPGNLGCPFIGTSSNLFSMFSYKKKKKDKLLDFNIPRLKLYYAFLTPIVFVSGVKVIKKILNSEFDSKGIEMASFLPNEKKMFGGQSILYSEAKDEHNFLRRLIGDAMTPSSLSKVIPELQNTATNHVESMISGTQSSSSIVGEDILHEFTLDVASKIIMGLALPKEEEKIVKEKLDILIEGLMSFNALINPFYKRTKVWKARMYLVNLIEKKIANLRESGPDQGSTLSAMVFAVDDESKQSLTDEQIIDNVIFLLIAGSETSSSTLTNCLLFLGLHPDVWNKVIEEQRELCKVHGKELTNGQLQNGCTYLEAVIKEAMRIRPISGGQYRKTKATMTVDGMQIPKGWTVVYNIRETHQLDPNTRLEDESHMDIMKGFKPERWLDKTTRPMDVDYIPFGNGPRYCLGANLAMTEMKVFLAVLARKATFDLVGVDTDNVEWKRTDLIAVPKDGVVMSVKPSTT